MIGAVRIQLDASTLGDVGKASRLEWLETNGRGGFAGSTVIGANTRRYHGLLVAALDPPVKRHVLLSRVEETVELAPGGPIAELGCNFYPGAVHPRGFETQVAFRLDPFPTFTWQIGERRIEKAVFLVHGEDTVVMRWSLLKGPPCALRLRPFVAFRDYHALMRESDDYDVGVRVADGRVTVQPWPSLPALHFHHSAREVLVKGGWWKSQQYPREQERGLDFEEDLWSPFELRYALDARGPLVLVASLSPSLSVEPARLEPAERARRASIVASTARAAPALDETLALGADAFLARRADGSATVIAGYPWFTDWGRDTMISLPGLTLCTGRRDEARDILLSFAAHLDRGMIPNRFPDSGEPPEYNNVDGTLWFAHAIGRWWKATEGARGAGAPPAQRPTGGGTPTEAGSQRNVLEKTLLPALLEIVKWHRQGTRYGIHVDADGLLAAGEKGVQLTWMDAKVDDWVVTPRMGKPVEVNALWIEALETTAELCRECGRIADAADVAAAATLARDSFVRRFWNERAACLFDVVDGPDGDDASLRPNQVFALALPHPAIDPKDPRAARILEAVRRDLLTPYGLRTLSPGDPRFARTYEGDRRARDGAYHQGTVWPWLIGAFVRAWLAVNGRDARTLAEARAFVQPLLAHLADAGLGQVSEIFDATAPFAPRGCPAQAWSLAELIRVLAEDLA